VTAAPPASASQQQHDGIESAFAIPLIVWLLIQLAAIALAASGVALSANFPRPPQSLAVHEMLVVQFVGSAMFLPVLFRGGWRSWLAIVACAGPMLALAAALARMPIARVPVLWVHVAAWVTMLALWSAVAKGRAISSIVAALAMLLSAGGLLVWYLQAEFQGGRDLWFLHFLPLPPVLRSLSSSSTPLSALPLLSTAAASIGALVILAAKTSVRRADGHAGGVQTTQSPIEK
jgi:hypothetical protein